MHFSVYLPDDLVKKIDIISKENHLNRSLFIRQALEKWIEHHQPKTWPINFFDFEPVEETPDFSLSRNELQDPKEWSFE